MWATEWKPTRNGETLRTGNSGEPVPLPGLKDKGRQPRLELHERYSHGYGTPVRAVTTGGTRALPKHSPKERK